MAGISHALRSINLNKQYSGHCIAIQNAKPNVFACSSMLLFLHSVNILYFLLIKNLNHVIVKGSRGSHQTYCRANF